MSVHMKLEKFPGKTLNCQNQNSENKMVAIQIKLFVGCTLFAGYCVIIKHQQNYKLKFSPREG